MTENRSLDDFFDVERDADAESDAGDGDGDVDADVDVDGDENGDAADGDTAAADGTAFDASEVDAAVGDTSDSTAVETADDVDSDAPAPTVEEPRTTVRWTPGGVDCRACGARVEREWRDGDRFVCADCKEW